MVQPGSSVRMQCGSADSTKWMKGSDEIAHLQSGNDIVIESVRNDHSGIYTCQGTKPSGEVFRSTTELRVESNKHSLELT